MPSIKQIDKFKSRIYSLAGEPDERKAQGLPPLDIQPPKSMVDDGLAELLGGMPLADQSKPSEEETPDLLGDFLGGGPSSPPSVNPEEMSLDDLISGMGGDVQASPIDTDDFLMQMAQADSSVIQEEEKAASTPDFGGSSFDSSLPGDLPDLQEEGEFGGEALGLEDLALSEQSPPTGEANDKFEQFDPSKFFEQQTPASSPDQFNLEDLAGPGEVSQAKDALADFDFGSPDTATMAEEVDEAEPLEGLEEGDANPFGGISLDNLASGDNLMGEIDHAGSDIWDKEGDVLGDLFLKGDLDEDMRGLAETTEKDVEAFDESKEAEEFSLDDFGYYGGDEEFVDNEAVLNPNAVFQVPETIEQPIKISESEFEQLKENLNRYPLNLKIAIEEVLSGEKDVPIAQSNRLVRELVSGLAPKPMAKLVGQILDKKIEIPPGFEKGTGELFQEQQRSLIYQAKEILVPILIRFAALSAAVGVVLLALGFFIYRPLRANWLFQRGYEELQARRISESEGYFIEALGMNDDPSWYLRYAQEYLRQENILGARIKYLQLLRPAYPLDRAGLQYQPQAPTVVIEDLDKMGYGGFDLLGLGMSPPAVQGIKLMNFMRPHRLGMIEWAKAEWQNGFDGKSADKHYLIAEKLLFRVKDINNNDAEVMLTLGDLYRDWAKTIQDERRSGLVRFDSRDKVALRREANRQYTDYTNVYTQDAAITYRWIEYFMEEDLTPQNTATVFREMHRLKESIKDKPNLRPTGIVLAKWAGWHFDQENNRIARLSLPQDMEARIRNTAAQGRGRAVQLLEENIPQREATGMEDFKIYFYYPQNYQRALSDIDFRPQIYVRYQTGSGLVREPFGPIENPRRMDIIQGGGGWYMADLVKVGIPPGQPVVLTISLDGRNLVVNKEFVRDRTGWLYIEDGFPMWFPQEPSIQGRRLLVTRIDPEPEISQQDLQIFRDWLLDAQNGSDATVPEIHFQLARYFRISGQFSEEQKALSAADFYFRELDSREQRKPERLALRIENLVRIGEIQREQGRTSLAESTFQEAKNLFESAKALGLWRGEVEQARLYGYLGDLYFLHAGEWGLALSYYDRAMTLGAITPTQRYRRAVALYQQNKFLEALNQFFLLERSREFKKNPNVRYALAASFFRLGNYATAMELYQELYKEIRSVVSRISDWQPQERDQDKELAENYYRVMNNLAAAQFFALAGRDRSHPSFGEVLSLIIEAKGVEDALGRRFGPNPEELERGPEIGFVGLNMQILLGGTEDPLIFPSLPLSPNSKTF